MPFLLPHRNLWIANFTLSQCGRFFSKSIAFGIATPNDWLKLIAFGIATLYDRPESNVALSQPNRLYLQLPFPCYATRKTRVWYQTRLSPNAYMSLLLGPGRTTNFS